MRWTTTLHSLCSLSGLLLFLGLFLASGRVRAQAVPAGQGLVADTTELRVLRQFYYATGGDQWTNRANWLQGTTLAEAAGWFGVTVQGGDVTALDFNANNLRGLLPASLPQLARLQRFSGRQNYLTGPLPAALGGLAGLQYLDASRNQLTGPLPDALAACPQLQWLYLSYNQFSGPLPAAWARLPQLHHLFLQGNALTGAIPVDWSKLTGLWILEISNNQLSGPLPDALANLTGLNSLGLASNRLTGSLQPLAGMTNLNAVNASGNQFSGPLPVGFSQLVHLASLYLDNNRLSGPLPAGLGSLPALYQLTLTNNHLSGTVPAEVLRMPGMRLLTLDRNDFTGIEDLSGATGLPAQVGLSNNALDFASLERLYQAPQQPRVKFVDVRWQRPPVRVDTATYQAGGALVLSVPAAERYAYHYQWQRLVAGQWVNMPGDTLLVKRRAAATAAEQGTYRLAVHDRWFTSGALAPTELYSAMVYADMLPYPPLARNRPDDANLGVGLVDLGPAPDATAVAPADVNFVRTWSPRVALTDANRVLRAPVDSVSTSTQYLDGLGRPVQTVLHQASPQRRDLVQPVAYDALGREARQYLPYPADGPAGGYRYRALTDQQAFYARTGASGGGIGPLAADDPTLGVARTGAAFTEVLFEASPLNRVAAQGAAGEAWQLTAGHVQERQERPNAAQDSVPRFAPGYDPAARDPHYQGFYAVGELWGTEVADAHGPNEPGAHGYRTLEWKDKLGQLVGKQVEAGRAGTGATARSRWLRTAYTYDDFERLRYVVQPEGTKRLLAAGGAAPVALPDNGPTAGLQRWLPLDETGGNVAADRAAPGQAATRSGGNWQPGGGHDGSGALFLAGADYLAIPLTWQPKAFSFSFWLKPTTLFNWSQITGAGWGAFLFHSTIEGYVYAGIDVPTRLFLATPNLVAANVWQHFVFTFDNGTGTLYKNGQVIGSRAGMALPAAWPGVRLNGNASYDEVRIYDRALATSEVQGLYAYRSVPAQALAAAAQPFTFRYRYDGRGRQIAKQVPGQDGESVVVYDALDRPVLTQDAAQRTRNEWGFTKYDALGRAVLTGLLARPDGADQPALQALAEAAPAPPYEQRTANGGAYPQFYTTDHAFPRLGQDGFGPGQVLAATYYDDYDFNNDGAADAAYDASTDAAFAGGAAPVADAQRVTEQVTRTLTRMLNRPAADPGAEWLATTTFYDERTRPVQVQTTNARGGLDLLTTQLGFTGQVVQHVAVHHGPNLAPPVQVAEFFTYDHTDRLLATRQLLPGEAQPALLARVQYNELGQALRKTLGTGRLAQDVDYAYNIRGWLTELNHPAQPDPADLFSLSLHYERGFTKGYEQYNGNLTGQTWRGRDGVQRAYGYVYDPLNRLLQGDFVARAAAPAGRWTTEEDHYRLSFVSYDDNGNLQTLRRQGLLANATHATAKRYGAVDNLAYAYAGNRLQAVDDQVSGNQLPRPKNYNGAPTSLAGDFQEQGVRQSQEYFYDANGNLTQDKNKGIGNIRYNYLNLPRLVQFGSGADSVVFRYAANGQKVAKLVYQTGKPVVRTDYLGPYQYESDSLRFFPHAEGRVLRFVSHDAANQPLMRYEREYTLKDHLGNLRLAYRAGHRQTCIAGMEQDDPTRKREVHQFDSLSVSPPVAQNVGNVGGLNRARTGSYVARLNAGGAAPQPLGPLKQLAVQKGDTVTVTAPGYYPQAVQSSSFAFSLAAFVASLVQQQPAPAPGADGSQRGALPLLSIGVSAALPALIKPSGGVPQGYVRLLVFDADSNLVGQQVQTRQLSAAAATGYEPLTVQVIAQQDGYVTAYVGNESNADVYFDDVQVTLGQGLQLQETEYDPAGLELAGLAPPSPGIRGLNQYRFNGKEFQADLGLNWNHQDWRFLDPQILRWHAVDPEVENGQESWTPYSFGYDNALRYNDPNGRAPSDHYFSPSGIFLGDDGMGTKVRVITENKFNEITEQGTKTKEKAAELQSSENSMQFSQAGLSTEASLKVYEHYNPTGILLTNTNDPEAVMQTVAHSTKPTELRINVDLSNKLNYSADYMNIKSSFTHEAKHIQDFKTLGFKSFHAASKLTKESRAYLYQMSQPGFQKTTPAYQYQVKTAAASLSNGVYFPLTPISPLVPVTTSPPTTLP